VLDLRPSVLQDGPRLNLKLQFAEPSVLDMDCSVRAKLGNVLHGLVTKAIRAESFPLVDGIDPIDLELSLKAFRYSVHVIFKVGNNADARDIGYVVQFSIILVGIIYLLAQALSFFDPRSN
jgi:hypothetical protein